jgi:hypothetical protein
MKNIFFVMSLIVALLLTSCSLSIGSLQTVEGSGILASENRPVTGFDSIELAGHGDVIARLGDSESVLVEAEDNLLPLIETKVRGGKLVINTKPNITLINTLPVRITITMKSFEEARLTGSGNITVNGLSAGKTRFDLPGSGNITADGVTDSVNVILGGSGNILAGDLQARSALVKLSGSGNVTVFASDRLDIVFKGSGNIHYRGSPADIRKSVTGSGSVQAEP